MSSGVMYCEEHSSRKQHVLIHFELPDHCAKIFMMLMKPKLVLMTYKS